VIEIRVQFLGNGGENLVYSGQANNLTLKLTNNSAGIIDVVPGAPADPPPIGGPFSIVLTLGELFTDPMQQQSMSITANGWTSQFFGGQFPSWVLTRQNGTQWLPDTSFSFAISGLTPTVSAGGYHAYVTIYNADPFPIAQSQPMTVAVQDSGAKDLALTFDVVVNPLVVYGTKTQEQVITNSFEIIFRNTNANDPLVPENVPWGSAPPQFSISFIYGTPPGAFALTTVSDANAFSTSISAGGAGWNPPSRLEGPSWLVSPKPQNHQILGTSLSSLVSFKFENVVTTFTPGVTQLYVQYSNIPGYRDGNFARVLYKEYKPVDIRFSINQSTFVLTGGAESARGFLSWNVDNAMLTELSVKGQVPRASARYEVDVERDMSYVLSAIDPITGTVKAAQQRATPVPSMTSRTIPPGTILLWHGNVNDLPAAFVVCDGTQGTPDLRDRFILAAGTSNAKSSGAPAHTHAYGTRINIFQQTTTDGVHSHSPVLRGWRSIHLDKYRTFSKHPGIDNGGSDIYGEPTQQGGSHSHGITMRVPGGTTEANTPELRPRWYALLYVMKRWAG
jgi:hypothetical protein